MQRLSLWKTGRKRPPQNDMNKGQTTGHTKPGPRDGERVLFCAHADVGPGHIDLSTASLQPFHWYKVSDDAGNPNRVKRPDGREFDVSWACICNGCFVRAGAGGMTDTYALERIIKRDAAWIGETPTIRPAALSGGQSV
jgi:hypothetical protein